MKKTQPKPKKAQPLGPDELARATIRRTRSAEDVERAQSVLKTNRATNILEAHPEERGSVRILEVDGVVRAALLFDPAPLEIRGVEVRCARIVETDGENGRKHFRATGDRELFDLLIEELFGYLWARRYPLVYAHGELALFGTQHFVPCFYHPRVSVPVAAALALPARYRVRHLKGDDVRHIPDLRALDRTHRPVVFAAGVPPFHHFCVEAPDRSVVGFFSFEASPEAAWTPKIFAPEVAVRDRETAFTILNHCAAKAHELGLEEMHFPLAAAHPFARICIELGGTAEVRGGAEDASLDEEMLCAVDPGRLLTALIPALEQAAWTPEPQEEREVTLSDGHGAWRLRLRDGSVSVETLDAVPEHCVNMPDWMLMQLLAGYRGGAEIDAPMKDEERALLQTLLPRAWPWSMCDLEHWDAKVPRRAACKAARKQMETLRLPWARGS